MKHTISTIKKAKNKQKLTMITAYDALFSNIFDENVDMILVGDSLNMSFLGKADTLSSTLKQMIYHTNAVCNGAKNTFIITDMPYGTYNNKKDAIKNCIKVLKKTNTNAVKIEGGKDKAKIIKALVKNAVPVVGHIGLMPQSVKGDGGYKIKGKNDKEIENLIQDAIAVQKAGAFLLVVEGVKAEVTNRITSSVDIPVIGIGSGLDVDGQVLVWSDMLGFFQEFQPKFVRKYLDGAELIQKALLNYTNDVKSEKFPNEDESY